MEFIHLLLSNLIGQNVQAMVQVIYQPRIEQSDWSEVTSHGTSDCFSLLKCMCKRCECNMHSSAPQTPVYEASAHVAAFGF